MKVNHCEICGSTYLTSGDRCDCNRNTQFAAPAPTPFDRLLDEIANDHMQSAGA